SVTASSPITFTLSAGATLDVFVANDLTTGDAFRSGELAFPSHTRFWVGGNATTSSEGTLHGLFYSPYRTFRATADLTMFGSIFTGSYNGESATHIHYDQAAAQAGSECPTQPPQTCGSTHGQACMTDTDCCQPLYCLPDHTCGFI